MLTATFLLFALCTVEFVKWHPVGNVVLAGSEDMTMWMWSVDLKDADGGAGTADNSPSYGQCMQVGTHFTPPAPVSLSLFSARDVHY